MNISEQIRQGDILLVPIDVMPKGFTIQSVGETVAIGEGSNHYHNLKQDIEKYARIIDTKDNYILFDLSIDGINLGRFMKMVDASSPREYLLRVPETKDVGGITIDIDTVEEALAWSFDMPSGDYNPTKES